MLAVALFGVTDGAPRFNVEEPTALLIVIVAVCVFAPAATTEAGDRFGAGHVCGGDVTVALGGAMPVPCKQTEKVGFVGSFVVMVSSPLRTPTAVGENVTVMGCASPGFTVPDAGESVNSAAFAPLTEPEKVRGLAVGTPVFLIVTTTEFELPTVTVPKPLGQRVVGATLAVGGVVVATHAFAPGGSIVMAPVAVSVHPVVTFKNTTSALSGPSCVPGRPPPVVQALVGNVSPVAGVTTWNAIGPK